MKPKKVTLGDGNVAWEVYFREAGRGSKQIRRRFPSSKLAQEFVADFNYVQEKTNRSGGAASSFASTTFAVESASWYEGLRLRCSSGHTRRAKDILEDFNSSYGHLEPDKITLDFLTGLQRKLKRRCKGDSKETWSNNSVNRYTEMICAVLNFAHSQRRIPYNPLTGFKKLPTNSPEMLFWEEQEAGSFLAWADAKYTYLSNQRRRKARKNYVAYLLALNTGMRAGEIWGLKPRDLSFCENDGGDTIFVRRQFHRIDRKLMPLKGGLKSGKDKSRHVPCSGILRDELKTLIEFNKTDPDQTIFQSPFGNPVDHDCFADLFARDLKEWGGRRIRFHDLRHTAATLMLAKGVDIKTVSEILGHGDLATTMIYVHLLGNRIKQVSKLFSVQPVALVSAQNPPASR